MVTGNPWGRKGRPLVPLTPARQRLAAKHFGLVEKVFCAHFVRARSADRDDYLSDGCLGLVQAALRWERGRCVRGRAAPYLARGIRNRMGQTRSHLHRGRKRWGAESISDMVEGDDGRMDRTLVAPTLGPPAVAMLHEVDDALEKLPLLMATIIKWHFYKWLSFAEIGRRLNLPPRSACYQCKRGLALLRKTLEG